MKQNSNNLSRSIISLTPIIIAILFMFVYGIYLFIEWKHAREHCSSEYRYSEEYEVDYSECMDSRWLRK